ncbi:MAG TPA: type II secretion system protein [Verrucomicrobiae bacterium]|nr:type II secretion system protein [Verrucomicrobiae bacterium]
MKIRTSSRSHAFTMVEIALCLAIVGFALVAIIGVLPTGMNVQKDNRQQTIVNQDAGVWLDALRNGAYGFDDLTNYVVAITNYWTEYEVRTDGTIVRNAGNENSYSYAQSKVTFPAGVPNDSFRLTNGYRIIGVLSTPKFWPVNGPSRVGLFTSNYVVAYVRSMSGAIVEKAPQRNVDVLDSAFTYRMVVENAPYVPAFLGDTNNATLYLHNLQLNNSTDVRLLFRWPALPTGIGNGRQNFRQMVAGSIFRRMDTNTPSHPVFFFEPSKFVQVQ